MTVYLTGAVILLAIIRVFAKGLDDYDDFLTACAVAAVWPLVAAVIALIITVKLLEKLRC